MTFHEWLKPLSILHTGFARTSSFLFRPICLFFFFRHYRLIRRYLYGTYLGPIENPVLHLRRHLDPMAKSLAFCTKFETLWMIDSFGRVTSENLSCMASCWVLSCYQATSNVFFFFFRVSCALEICMLFGVSCQSHMNCPIPVDPTICISLATTHDFLKHSILIRFKRIMYSI
jgi:hypothetical protein